MLNREKFNFNQSYKNVFIMKKLYTLIFGALSVIGLAQAPANYYSGTEGLTKEQLKSKLSYIISQNHKDNGYSGLWTGYRATDVDNYYEKDGTLLDIYSEIPSGEDSYAYTIGTNQCGNGKSVEGTCYNREHIVPRSLFKINSKNYYEPANSDIHFVVPTDYWVNNKRSRYPFGVVSTATWTSTNGTKVGKDASGNNVFEPIDEFKGDIARMVFYFATRYEDQLSGFETGGILGGSAYPGIDATQLEVLLKWHQQDPVSEREIARNNAAYQFQGNRNPYIDNPDWVNVVWSETSSTGTPTNPTPPVIPPTTSDQCSITEDFESLEVKKNQYLPEVVWTKNGITWTATSSRTDLEIDGKALTIRNGSLTSSTIAGGIGSLTLTTKLPFKDKAGDLIVKVNDVEVGKITYVAGGELTTTTIDNINIEGNVVISIVNETSNRVAIDNLSWTCYSNNSTPPIDNKDAEAPTMPTNVVITDTTTESISLEWTASKDNVGVVAYNVYVDGVLVATVSTSNAAITGLNPDTEYSFTIVAKDKAGNQSAQSDTIVGRTKAVVVIDPKPIVEMPRYTLPNVVEKGKMAIYPNPVRSYEPFVIYGLERGKVYTAEVYNSAGRLITKFENIKGEDAMITINQHLASDVYILRVNGKGIKFIVK